MYIISGEKNWASVCLSDVVSYESIFDILVRIVGCLIVTHRCEICGTLIILKVGQVGAEEGTGIERRRR